MLLFAGRFQCQCQRQRQCQCEPANVKGVEGRDLEGVWFSFRAVIREGSGVGGKLALAMRD
jgi:hypothetical protein